VTTATRKWNDVIEVFVVSVLAVGTFAMEASDKTPEVAGRNKRRLITTLTGLALQEVDLELIRVTFPPSTNLDAPIGILPMAL
jgi:hypothetical protein